MVARQARYWSEADPGMNVGARAVPLKTFDHGLAHVSERRSMGLEGRGRSPPPPHQCNPGSAPAGPKTQ